MTAGDALHAGGEDAAHPPIGVVLGRLLGLADELGGVVAQLVLELAQEDLPGLLGGEVGDPLELAELELLRRLELERGVVEVASAVVEGTLAPLELGQADAQRLLLREQALLDPGDLGPALAEVGVELLALTGERGGVGGRLAGVGDRGGTDGALRGGGERVARRGATDEAARGTAASAARSPPRRVEPGPGGPPGACEARRLGAVPEADRRRRSARAVPTR